MRRVLVDHARRRSYLKRGGGIQPITLLEIPSPTSPRGHDLLALDEALGELEKMDARQRQIVELRFFGGLTHEEIGEALGVSVSTVERKWRLARAWLFRRLRPQAGTPGPISEADG
jgi:RNA polymerase sigma factor (TIGR02999 family)